MTAVSNSQAQVKASPIRVMHVLGQALDSDYHERLHDLEHRNAVDILILPAADLARKRIEATSQAGRQVQIMLPRDEQLRDGSVLFLDAAFALVLRVREQRHLRLRASTIEDALALGYHAGNLHWKVRFDGGTLIVALDGEPEAYIHRLEALFEKGRIQVSLDQKDQ